MYKLHTHCRACSDLTPQADGIKALKPPTTLTPVFDLGPMPLANDFRKDGEERAGYAPLKVMYCTRCGLAQLSVTVNPEVMYRRYSYVTSPSETMAGHFAEIRDDYLRECGGKLGKVLEIGSNTGALLKHLAPDAEAVLGVDPAENLAAIAKAQGVPTHTAFWGHFAAAQVSALFNGHPDLIIARHVFCHLDDWRTAIDAIASLCGDRTVVAIEVPWVMDLLDNNRWDTIYHEHLSYMNIGAMQALLRGTKLKLVHVRHHAIHGGAITLYLRHQDGQPEVSESVEKFFQVEFNRLSDGVWRRLNATARKSIRVLKEYVRGLNTQGKRVCGYGASAKSSSWVAACGFDKLSLEAVYDTTLEKWNTTVPGTDIPVKHAGMFYADAADYAVMFCWNFEREVLAKERKWLAGGGKFIIPVPEVQVVGAEEAARRLGA